MKSFITFEINSFLDLFHKLDDLFHKFDDLFDDILGPIKSDLSSGPSEPPSEKVRKTAKKFR